jgi:hypothetical protein
MPFFNSFALNKSALRGRIALPERTFAECYCHICGIFSAPRSGLGMAGAKQRQKGPCLETEFSSLSYLKNRK